MRSDHIHYYRSKAIIFKFLKSNTLIEDLKKYQSIQKSHEGIKNQVFILVILF